MRKFNGIFPRLLKNFGAVFSFSGLIRFALWAKGKSDSSISSEEDTTTLCLSRILFAGFYAAFARGEEAEETRKFVVFIFNLCDAWQHFIFILIAFYSLFFRWLSEASVVLQKSFEGGESLQLFFILSLTKMSRRTREINVLYKTNKQTRDSQKFFQMSQQISSKLIPSSFCFTCSNKKASREVEEREKERKLIWKNAMGTMKKHEIYSNTTSCIKCIHNTQKAG